jgi:hypothetical protein
MGFSPERIFWQLPSTSVTERALIGGRPSIVAGNQANAASEGQQVERRPHQSTQYASREPGARQAVAVSARVRLPARGTSERHLRVFFLPNGTREADTLRTEANEEGPPSELRGEVAKVHPPRNILGVQCKPPHPQLPSRILTVVH